MSVIEGAENLPRAVSLNSSYDKSAKLVKYLRRKLEVLGFYKVFNGTIERPNHVNVFVIDLRGESADRLPLYENGIPLLYYNTSTKVDDDDDDDDDEESDDASGDDSESDNDAAGDEESNDGGNNDDEESDASGDDDISNDEESDGSVSGDDDDEEVVVETKKIIEKSVTKKKPSVDDKQLRKTARAIANTIKDMHIAYDKEDLIRKIHQLGDVVTAKAYTRNVFDSSDKFTNDEERRRCKEGIDDAALDSVFLDVARRMPSISPPR